MRLSRDMSTPGSIISEAAADGDACWLPEPAAYADGACCGDPPTLLSLLLSGDPATVVLSGDNFAVKT